jgi:aminopeptidase N
MTLHQLRLSIGDDDFFRLLRTWTRTHADGNGTTEQFIALAGRISGQDLAALFQTWLYTPTRPELAGAQASARSTSAAFVPAAAPAAVKRMEMAGSPLRH